MAHVLTEYPLDFARPEVNGLRELFATAVFRPRDVEDLVLRAQLNPGYIDFSGSASLQWFSIMNRARAEGKLPGLLTIVRQAHPPLGPRIDELLAATPVLQPSVVAPLDLQTPDGAGWLGFGSERQVVEGVDTLLGIAFLEQGLARSRAICRLGCGFVGKAAHGTGALIGPDLLLTNYHVLHDLKNGGARAQMVDAWFDYELDVAGEDKKKTVVTCDPTSIVGDPRHDWAVIRTVDPPPPTSTVLSLASAEAPRKDDYVFIIQHPEGGPKMIGLSHNLVRSVDDDVLQYWTDTKAGSSGSPVFNTAWQVVGLHHLWLTAPPEDGVAYRNQGRRIERVREGLDQLGVAWGPDPMESASGGGQQDD